MNRYPVLALAVLVAIPFSGLPAAAQPVLTLTDALAAALRDSDEVAAASAAASEATERVSQASAGYLPRIDFAQSWQRGDQPVFVFGSLLAQRQFTAADFGLTQLNTPNPITNGRTAFYAEQLIFDGGRTRAGARAAARGADIAQQGQRQVRNDLSLAVTRAYGAVLRAAAAGAAAQSAVAAAEEDARTAEARRDAGTGTEADVLSLRVHLAEMRARAIDAASGVRIARAELNRSMREPLEREFAVVEPAIIESPPEPVGPLMERALRDRPEISVADLQIAVSQALRDGARSALLPQVAAQAGYEWNDGSRGSPASAWIAGATIRMNVFAGGGNLARVHESTHGLARARLERDRIAGTVRAEVLTATEQLASARARHDVGRSAVAHARESQRMIRDRHEAGLAPAGDVIRAATAALDAEVQRIGAVVDVIVAEAALRRAIGTEGTTP